MGDFVPSVDLPHTEEKDYQIVQSLRFPLNAMYEWLQRGYIIPSHFAAKHGYSSEVTNAPTDPGVAPPPFAVGDRVEYHIGFGAEWRPVTIWQIHVGPGGTKTYDISICPETILDVAANLLRHVPYKHTVIPTFVHEGARAPPAGDMADHLGFGDDIPTSLLLAFLDAEYGRTPSFPRHKTLITILKKNLDFIQHDRNRDLLGLPPRRERSCVFSKSEKAAKLWWNTHIKHPRVQK